MILNLSYYIWLHRTSCSFGPSKNEYKSKNLSQLLFDLYFILYENYYLITK